MVILITGKAGAGKTRYAKELAKELMAEGKNVVRIDGDEWRKEHENKDFSDEGRILNLMSAAELAGRLEANNIVIMSFVAPKKEWRNMMRGFWAKSRVVYIPGGTLWEGTTYETPTDEELSVLEQKH